MAKRRTKKIKGTFCERKVAPKSRFDKHSFRWKKQGRNWIMVGCPKGKWKSGRCRVGTRAHVVLAPRKGNRCPVGQSSIKK